MQICCAGPSRCRRGMDCSLQLLRRACWSGNTSLMHSTLPGRRGSQETHQWHLRHLAEVSARGSVFLSMSVTEEMIERMRAKPKPSTLLSKFIFGCPEDPTQAPPLPAAPQLLQSAQIDGAASEHDSASVVVALASLAWCWCADVC